MTKTGLLLALLSLLCFIIGWFSLWLSLIRISYHFIEFSLRPYNQRHSFQNGSQNKCYVFDIYFEGIEKFLFNKIKFTLELKKFMN